MNNISATGAILVLALGILIGQTSSHYMIKLIDIGRVMITAEAMSEQVEAQREAMKANMEAQAIENEKRRDRIRKLKETCDYWTLETQRNPTTQYLTYKAAACDRYRNAL